MSRETNIPFAVKQAAKKFHRTRADYYRYMSAILRQSAGGMKIMQLFENDIERYEGEARGKLCSYWHDVYSENGGNLADAFQGTLPDDEVAILRVAQDAGGDALIVALDDVARMAKLSDLAKKETINTLFAGIAGISIAAGMVSAFPIFSTNAIGNAYDFLPMEFYGKNGKRLFAYADWVAAYGIYIAIALAALTAYVYWTIPNLTNKVREWLDENVVLYRVIRDLRGALFLSTMSTLTRKRGGLMMTLKQSLETFADSARTPWLKWRINQIIDNADETGALGVNAFETGLISKEMYFFLEDMQKSRGFAEGFEEAGKYVEESLMESLIKRMTFYRWLMLLGALVVTLAMFAWQFQVIYEMRGAMSSYLASG